MDEDDGPIHISRSQEELLQHSAFLLNPLPSSPTSDGLFAPSSNETPCSPHRTQQPILMLSLGSTPDDDHLQTTPVAPIEPDTVVPESEPPHSEPGPSSASPPPNDSDARPETKPTRRRGRNRWRVSFRKSPVAKESENCGEENPFKEYRYREPDSSKVEDAIPPARKLPASMRTGSPAKRVREEGDEISLLRLVEDYRGGDAGFPADIFDVVRALAGRRERTSEGVDLLDVARGKGICFPTPKWHRKEGYGAEEK